MSGGRRTASSAVSVTCLLVVPRIHVFSLALGILFLLHNAGITAINSAHPMIAAVPIHRRHHERGIPNHRPAGSGLLAFPTSTMTASLPTHNMPCGPGGSFLGERRIRAIQASRSHQLSLLSPSSSSPLRKSHITPSPAPEGPHTMSRGERSKRYDVLLPNSPRAHT